MIADSGVPVLCLRNSLNFFTAVVSFDRVRAPVAAPAALRMVAEERESPPVGGAQPCALAKSCGAGLQILGWRGPVHG